MTNEMRSLTILFSLGALACLRFDILAALICTAAAGFFGLGWACSELDERLQRRRLPRRLRVVP